jgi:hypothetical protein
LGGFPLPLLVVIFLTTGAISPVPVLTGDAFLGDRSCLLFVGGTADVTSFSFKTSAGTACFRGLPRPLLGVDAAAVVALGLSLVRFLEIISEPLEELSLLS